MTPEFQKHILMAKARFTDPLPAPLSNAQKQRALGPTERRRGHDYNNLDPKDSRARRSNFITWADMEPRQPMFMSAKLKGTIELITEWQTEVPDDKIIGGQLFIDCVAWALTSTVG